MNTMPYAQQSIICLVFLHFGLITYNTVRVCVRVELEGYATLRAKLQALVYDILPSTTAIFSYAIGSRKLS